MEPEQEAECDAIKKEARSQARQKLPGADGEAQESETHPASSARLTLFFMRPLPLHQTLVNLSSRNILQVCDKSAPAQ